MLQRNEAVLLMASRLLVPQMQRLVRLMKRPKGHVVPGVDLVLDPTAPVPAPSSLQPGEILVRNLFLSLDPAMRGWMNEGKSYVPPVPLGDIMRGGAIGAVVHSMNDKFARGDLVSGLFGWCEYAVASKAIVKLPSSFQLHDSTAWLGVLGMPGLTAYFGTFEVMRPKAGDTVVVSAAAGAVGSVVVCLAKRVIGCRVVAIAGGSEKCAWLKSSCGADVVIDYKNKETFTSEFKAATASGVDCYFDNVGGPLLDMVLNRLNKGARIAICGAISQYNAASKEEVFAPRNYMSLLVNSASMRGFVVFDFASQYKEAVAKLQVCVGVQQMRVCLFYCVRAYAAQEWLSEGKIVPKEHIVNGDRSLMPPPLSTICLNPNPLPDLGNAAGALQMLFDGRNDGKLIVRIDPSASASEAALSNIRGQTSKL